MMSKLKVTAIHGETSKQPPPQLENTHFMHRRALLMGHAVFSK